MKARTSEMDELRRLALETLAIAKRDITICGEIPNIVFIVARSREVIVVPLRGKPHEWPGYTLRAVKDARPYLCVLHLCEGVMVIPPTNMIDRAAHEEIILVEVKSAPGTMLSYAQPIDRDKEQRPTFTRGSYEIKEGYSNVLSLV